MKNNFKLYDTLHQDEISIKVAESEHKIVMRKQLQIRSKKNLFASEYIISTKRFFD